MDPITNLIPVVENRSYLTNKYINLYSGTILNYFSLILVNDGRILSLTPEYSNVGGVS